MNSKAFYSHSLSICLLFIALLSHGGLCNEKDDYSYFSKHHVNSEYGRKFLKPGQGGKVYVSPDGETATSTSHAVGTGSVSASSTSVATGTGGKSSYTTSVDGKTKSDSKEVGFVKEKPLNFSSFDYPPRFPDNDDSFAQAPSTHFSFPDFNRFHSDFHKNFRSFWKRNNKKPKSNHDK